MGLGQSYGHAGNLLELHGQEKRKATLAKKKREKKAADITPQEIIEWFKPDEYKGLLRFVCPYCGGTERGEKPHIHIHPEDNEAFEVKLHPMLFQPVAFALDFPEAKKKKKGK